MERRQKSYPVRGRSVHDLGVGLGGSATRTQERLEKYGPNKAMADKALRVPVIPIVETVKFFQRKAAK